MKKFISLITVIICSAMCLACADSNLIIVQNRQNLENTIREKCISYTSIALKELTPFEWDVVYLFEPYTSPEEIYDTVGYKWRNIPELDSEDFMAVVFIKDRQVMCDYFGRSNFFYLGSSSKTLFRKDNPIFIVTSLSNGFSTVEWVDWSLLYSKPVPSPDEIVGEWECVIDAANYTEKITFALVNDGFAKGSIFFRNKNGKTDGPTDEFGLIDFAGAFDGEGLKCTVSNYITSAEAKSIYEISPHEFNINYNDGILSMNSSLLVNINGRIALDLSGDVTFYRRK